MKLNKTSLLLILVGVLVIAFANLSAAHSKQVTGQNQLNTELNLAKQRLSKLSLDELNARKAVLQQQLTQTNDTIDNKTMLLSLPINSMDTSDNLLSIAQSCNVWITGISSSELVLGNLGDITCSILRVVADVKGTVPDIMNFVYRLNDSLSTDAITAVDFIESEDIIVPVGGAVSVEESNPPGAIITTPFIPSATIKFNVYIYEGG